jgi:hypothetical protein
MGPPYLIVGVSHLALHGGLYFSASEDEPRSVHPDRPEVSQPQPPAENIEFLNQFWQKLFVRESSESWEAC